MPPFFLVILASTVLHVLAAEPDNPGDGEKPFVTLVPDWRKMFYNETLTIACLGGKGQRTYTWYRNNNKLDTNQQNFTIDSIQLYDRANYQCRAGSSDISDVAYQRIITDLAILRVPRLVFEGDILNFTCDSRLDMNTTDAVVSFHKGAGYLKGKSKETSLFLGKADNSMSGNYKCSKEAYLNGVLKSSEDEENIEIIELFSQPELKVNSNPIQVGFNMTLTCVTTLHPLRAGADLQFAFYRNGWHVQGFSSSNTFTIPSASNEDSGDYACEVQTSTNSIRKISKLSSIQVQAVKRPTVVFSPNVDKILRTEQITIRCVTSESFSWRQTYTWYKNNVIMPSESRQLLNVYSAGDSNIGSYQCQTSSGEKSLPVHLDVFFVWLILQAPNSIHEGDGVKLSCHMWRTGKALNTTFYKDDKMIKFLDNLSDLDLGTVSKEASGKYKCTKFINTGSASKIYTAEEFISVADLFSPPEVKVSPYSMIEGADMTLTCHTVLSPSRQSTKLQFAFYKDGQLVQGFGTSEKYEVQSAQPRDSAKYTCTVKNIPGTVTKTSKVIPIQIQGMALVALTPNVGKIITGESIFFMCKVDSNMKGDQTFYWYKDNDKLRETQQNFTIKSASVNDSGNYQCRSSVTHLSDLVRLDVSNSDLILQAPPVINEGDELTLGCHHRAGMDFARVEFYKDGVFTKILGSESDLRLGRAFRNMTGAYRCTKKKGLVNPYLAEVFVSVTELFPHLQLKASQDLVVEGDNLVLSCQTALNSALSPFRGKTEIQYAFYRDGKNVQLFSTSDNYVIVSAQQKDSGNYTCEVKSSTNVVTKMSQTISVDVQDLFPTPDFYVNANPIIQGRSLILTCLTTLNSQRQSTNLEYTFYKNEKNLQNPKSSTKYRIDRVSEGHSGEYSCEASSSANKVVKKSNTTSILVQVPVLNAQITMDRQEPDMTSGLSVTFKCSVQHGTAPSFTWLHNSKELDQNCMLYNISHDGTVLFINSAHQHHSGTYQCQVKNSFSDSMSKVLRINVAEPATVTAQPKVVKCPKPEPVAQPKEVKCPKQENTNSSAVPVLIVLVVVALVVILSLPVIYRYRHRLPILNFTLLREKIIASEKQDEDSLLCLENMDSSARFSNSHH